MPRARLLPIAVSLFLFLGALGPATSPAAHFYLQIEANEEFKKITSTVEATLASNAELEFLFTSGANKINVHCHSEGREELFTSGTASVTELKFTLCETLVNKVLSVQCRPESVAPKKLPIGTELTEIGKPIVYGQKFAGFEVKMQFSEECIFLAEKLTMVGNLEAEVFNTTFLELIFPEPRLKGTTLTVGGNQATVLGRLRVTPTLGRALEVGP